MGLCGTFSGQGDGIALLDPQAQQAHQLVEFSALAVLRQGQGGVRVLLGLLDQQAGRPGMDTKAVLNDVSKLLQMFSPDLVCLLGLGFQHVNQLVADDLQGFGAHQLVLGVHH